MRPIQPQRRSSAGFWLGLMLLVLAAVGGLAALLFTLGLGPWSTSAVETFVVRIPINALPIPAYVRVQREHLMNPATRTLTFQNIPPQSTVGMSISGISTDNTPVDGKVDSIKNDNDTVVFVVEGKEVLQSRVNELGGALMNVSAIIGRVVRRDKTAGKGFRESTFFPRGTPEGIAGATPRGMSSLTLDATRLTGIHSLNSGNRLDLIASMPMGSASGSQPSLGLLTGNQPDSREQETEPVLLAQNALLLRPVTIRNESSTTASLTQGKRQVNEPKYEVTIAVQPDDVIPLQNAIDQGLKITCVANSMQPESNAEDDASVDVAENGNVEPPLMAPVTVRRIAAYAVIQREGFVSPATRKIKFEPVTQRQVDQFGIVLDINEMLGAVARHDIPAGSYVSHNDLLQSQRRQRNQQRTSAVTSSDKTDRMTSADYQTTALPLISQQDDSQGANIVGDRPAVTSFIPPGRTAIAIPWNMIFGAEHLQIDDRIDLLASYGLEGQVQRRTTTTETTADGATITTEAEEYAQRSTDRTRNETLGNRGEPWFVATDAIVLGPVGFPAPNAALRAIGREERIQTGANATSGPAILLAIDPRDIETVSTVLNTPSFLLSVAFRAREDQAVAPPGFRKIGVAPVSIPAYSKFSDLRWKGLRREITSRLVRNDDRRFVDPLSVEEIEQYYGRTLRRAKDRFASFTAADFLPEGVNAGEVAGIQTGHVLFIVEQNSGSAIAGLNRFKNDDRVAIVESRNIDLPNGAVLHGTVNLNFESKIIVSSARILRESSDITDSVALEVPTSAATQLSNALFEGESRLLAIALPRQNTASPADVQIMVPLQDFAPLKAAPKVYEVTGGQSRLHIFESAKGDSL